MQMRAFIGIDLENKMKTEILSLQRILRNHASQGRWKHSDNFHLTLKFLDEISLEQKRQIDEAMKKLCAAVKPFTLSLSGLGIFPGRDAVRVLWLGLTGDVEELQALYEGINKQLMPLGFPTEKRGYSPHITLGQDIVFKAGFDEVKHRMGEVRFEAFKVKQLYLFKSEQVQNKRIYSKISEYVLE